MNTVFGEIIRKEWRKSAIPQKEFADKLKMSLRNAQNLFERDDFSISQLMAISKVLNHDFVALYLRSKNYSLLNSSESVKGFEDHVEEYISAKKAESNQISVNINIKGDIDAISKNFPSLLQFIKNEAEKYGLTIA